MNCKALLLNGKVNCVRMECESRLTQPLSWWTWRGPLVSKLSTQARLSGGSSAQLALFR